MECWVGAVHKLCCLKIGNFRPPPPLSSILLSTIYVVNRLWDYSPPTPLLPRRHSLWTAPNYTFSIKSMQACKSIPKSKKVHVMPSLWYSSCSNTNMWWLKNCCSFSFVKLMQSCSKLLSLKRVANNKVNNKLKRLNVNNVSSGKKLFQKAAHVQRDRNSGY